MKKALLIGDGGSGVFYPVEEMGEQLREIFEDCLSLEILEDYDSLTAEKLREYRLLICDTDPAKWDGKRGKALVAALIIYAVNGGGVLGIHNGLIQPDDHEMSCLWGASLRTRLPAGLLDYTPTREEHLILDAGCTRVTLEEEPLIFDFDLFAEKNRFFIRCAMAVKRFLPSGREPMDPAE